MAQNSSRPVGRHSLHIPGPTPGARPHPAGDGHPMIDHRGPEFSKLAKQCLEGIKTIFKTANPVIIYTATGTGAWEARAGQHTVARRQSADGGDRPVRHAVEEDGARSSACKPNSSRPTGAAAPIRPRSKRACARTRRKTIKAVCVLHNETSTGALSPIDESARRSTRRGHPALLMVDTISSLASTDYRHDEWGVDVTVGGSQKGLMLPPGMSFNAVSDKALAAAQDLQAAEIVLGVGRDDRHEQESASSPTRRRRRCCRASPWRSTCCTRKASTTCSRATTGSPRRRGARYRPGASRSSAAIRNIIRRPSPPSLLPDGHDADAFRGAGARALQHLLWRELRPLPGQDVPHRPSRRHQRYDDDGRAGGDRNGAATGRRSDQKGRRAGGDGLSRRRARQRGETGGGVSHNPFVPRASGDPALFISPGFPLARERTESCYAALTARHWRSAPARQTPQSP